MKYHVKVLNEYDAVLSDKLRKYCFDIIGLCQTVHNEMGPFLNEYMYQDALEVIFEENKIIREKEYYFSVMFHGVKISHRHFVDFLVKDKIFLECKAVAHLGSEQRQQLWNYMRLTNTRIGILYNFAPIMDECERYYYDPNDQQMYMF